jgi:hypothetical protein
MYSEHQQDICWGKIGIGTALKASVTRLALITSVPGFNFHLMRQTHRVLRYAIWLNLRGDHSFELIGR